MRTRKRDTRVEAILQKYYGLYDLPEGVAKPNELD
jgi:hypothetical protein